MRITICGSMKFADRIVKLHARLKELGHEPLMHEDVFKIAEGKHPEFDLVKGSREPAAVKRKYNYIKWWHSCIKSGDAVLIANFDKKGTKDYIGGNTLVEIGFAHVNDKKVFLLNRVPEDVPYADEINAMIDLELEGDLSKITGFEARPKVFICGSMGFAREMLEAQKALEGKGIDAIVPTDTHSCLENPGLNVDLDYCIKTDIDREQWKIIEKCDAVLALNMPKNDIDGYVGGATLTDMAIARHFGKKVFLLNKPADESVQSHSLEVKAMQPIVLEGKLENLEEHMQK